MMTQSMIALIGAGSILAVCVALSLERDLSARQESRKEPHAQETRRLAYASSLTTQVLARPGGLSSAGTVGWDTATGPRGDTPVAYSRADRRQTSAARTVYATEIFFRGADSEPLPVDAIEFIEGLDPETVMAFLEAE